MKIVFFGTPEPAKEVFEALMSSDHEVVGVITKPDKKRGRGSKLVSTPVKISALESKVQVFEPESKAELETCMKEMNADVGVVVAFGQILPASVLEHFPRGCINVHYSMLPKFRGAAPVERAILAGETSTGVSIMQMDEGLDTGAVYAYRNVDILDDTNTKTLFRALNSVASDLLMMVLDNLETEEPKPQAGEASYASKLSAQDFYFDSQSSVFQVDRQIRAGALVKGAWTDFEGKKLRILQAHISKATDLSRGEMGTISRKGELTLNDGVLEIEKIQMPGKPVLDFNAWANGIAKERFPIKLSS